MLVFRKDRHVFTVVPLALDNHTRYNWGVRSLPWMILTDKNHIVAAEGFTVSELDEKN